jgi:hypothetical protein
LATPVLFQAKPLGCYGDGGACFTNDPELAITTALKKIRQHIIGIYNTPLQAAQQGQIRIEVLKKPSNY